MKLKIQSFLGLIGTGLLFFSYSMAQDAAGGESEMKGTLKTQHATFMIDNNGALASIVDNKSLKDYRCAGQSAPLLQILSAGKWHKPISAEWIANSNRLTLRYKGELSLVVRCLAKPTHVSFEIMEATPKDKVEMVWWGPYPTIINRVIGEMVGVVRDREFAVGIQVLNMKTIGGSPGEDNFQEARRKLVDPYPHDGIQLVLERPVQHFGNTAQRTDFGGQLQAYCRNRELRRTINVLGNRVLTPSYKGDTVVGSKIALFACQEPQALATIGKIEIAEGLSHPMLDGEWVKTSPRATESYIGFAFGEDTIDACIKLAKQSGIRWIYHPSPWETWGHFRPKPGMFPHGMIGLKDCVDKAHKAGLRVGTHTLTTFMTADDAYVTGGDPRLAVAWEGTLAKTISATATEIELNEKPNFGSRNSKILIGNEIILFKSVSPKAPWRLKGCVRASYKTKAQVHLAGGRVAKLTTWRFGGDIFGADLALNREVAEHCAKICEIVGLDQFCFDGLESNWTTGLGEYGRARFVQSWYDALPENLRGRVMLDGSNAGNYLWHHYNRANWGEPWYASFRLSMLRYRMDMVRLQARNYLPRMLGQFAAKKGTKVEDIEWMCGLAAGYDAGFSLSFVESLYSYIRGYPISKLSNVQFPGVEKIAAALRTWETARHAGAFPDEIKARLQDWKREFHLEPVGPGEWDLYEIIKGKRGPAIRLKTTQK